ncbi:MAG TPA: hypothetical protein VNH65_02585 [Candidatus Acidoferrum sp.]|nr:hypothetical protein [Candidatus Acidoferrum sp.]
MARLGLWYDEGMSKLIIYLDQNFVSEMAKAKFLGDPVRASKTAPYGSRYDNLKNLVENELAICPESLFHQLESENAELATASQKLVTRLSYGLRLHSPWEIAAHQALRAAKTFLSLGEEEAPPWQDAFLHDPHESVDNRALTIGSGRAILSSPWSMEACTVKPTAYMSDRREMARNKFTWTDLSARKRCQEEGIIDALFIHPKDSHCRGAAIALQNYWPQRNVAPETFSGFLKSKELRGCPFISILSTLCAALDCQPNRGPKPSDAFDTLILATVLPYCDVVATSSDLEALWQQTRLRSKFKAQVYGAKQVQLKEFDDWLTTALASAPPAPKSFSLPCPDPFSPMSLPTNPLTPSAAATANTRNPSSSRNADEFNSSTTV